MLQVVQSDAGASECLCAGHDDSKRWSQECHQLPIEIWQHLFWWSSMGLVRPLLMLENLVVILDARCLLLPTASTLLALARAPTARAAIRRRVSR